MADDTTARRAEPVDEFEREPVPERAWLGFSSFVGQYAGEHTAGTELMIGPLFIASGVSAIDVVGGLFVGQPARRAELGVPDGAHRGARAHDAVLPAREDLRAHGWSPPTTWPTA